MMLCSGIGSAPGLSGPRSQASVQAERNWRAGLPVRPLERTASREEAAIIFSRKISTGLGFDRGQPHRAGPDAGRAHRHAGRHLPPGHDAAGGQHRHVADRLDRLDHLGHQHHGRDLAAMAAGLGALHHQDVDAGRDLADARAPWRRPGPRPGTPCFLPISIIAWRRHAQRVGDQPDRMLERGLEHFQRALARRTAAADCRRRSWSSARRRTSPAGCG